jgi:hypothetical protein
MSAEDVDESFSHEQLVWFGGRRASRGMKSHSEVMSSETKLHGCDVVLMDVAPLVAGFLQRDGR